MSNLDIPEVELEMARQYAEMVLQAGDPQGEELIKFVARYGYLRQLNGGQMLRSLLQEERDPRPDEIAFREFNGVLCTGCEEKKLSSYWFCESCWKIVSKVALIREALWRRRFEPRYLPEYYRAKAILREERAG